MESRLDSEEDKLFGRQRSDGAGDLAAYRLSARLLRFSDDRYVFANPATAHDRLLRDLK